MSRLKLLTVPVVVAATLVAGVYGVAYGVAAARSSGPAPEIVLGPRSDAPNSQTQIAFWSRRVASTPDAYLDLTLLGQAFARRARETSDVLLYTRAEAAFRRALRIDPSYVQASAALASVLFSMHEFERSLAVARPLVDDPRAVQALGTVGDGELALGRYREAADAYAGLRRWGESPGVYSRLALLAELRGAHPQALRLMERAARLAEDSGDYGESLAWYSYQLGELHFRTGDLPAADENYRRALVVFPEYPLALAGLGKAKAAEGDLPAAIGLYRHATAIVPQPDLLAALGDLYAATGRPTLAREQWRTVTFIAKLARLNRQVYNRQLAVFEADHGVRLGEARRLALRELRVRRDIYGYDAAAWALARSGRCREALPLARRALALGTRDALLSFHRGYAEGCAGHRAAMRRWYGRALALNPAFSVRWAPVARAALARTQPSRT